LALIPARTWWQELREFRNQVAHEYPDRQSEQAVAINAIYDRCNDLVRVFSEFVCVVEKTTGGLTEGGMKAED